MSHLNITEIANQNKKDNIKGQKIVAALYLVTNHLSDTDPLKTKLRSLGVALVEGTALSIHETASSISTLLNVAGLANLISPKNVSILVLEVEHYASMKSSDDALDTYFEDKHVLIKRTYQGHTVAQLITKQQNSGSNNKKLPQISSKSENKDKRQNDILSFINIRKSVAIKDIATLFPSVSEKTIQRELTALVSSGKITKRGSKRWSIYMAI